MTKGEKNKDISDRGRETKIKGENFDKERGSIKI
jgi:hypothetical protein